MPTQIKESDWKIFKQLHSIALERRSEKLVADIERMLAEQGKPALDRFHDVSEFVREQRKELSRLFDDFRRSTALLQLSYIRAQNLLTDEEISRFSPETIEFVDRFLQLARGS